jgi:WD40 repeat protein
MLASGSNDESVILWDVKTGGSIGYLGRDLNWVMDISFNSHDSTLVAATGNGEIVAWIVSVEAWKCLACKIANRNLTLDEWQLYLGNEPYRKTCPNISS